MIEIKSNNFDYNAFEIIAELCDDEEKVVKRDFPNIPIGIPIVNNFYDIFSFWFGCTSSQCPLVFS
jgi:hypothetical protein